MINVRVLKGLEYGKELYELKGKLYGCLSCQYETRERNVGLELHAG